MCSPDSDEKHFNWVRLGQTLETLDELWQIGWVLWCDGHLHDRGYRVLHDLDIVGILLVSDGTSFQNVGVNANKTDGVTTRDVINSLSATSHHDHGTLNVLAEKVLLLAWKVIRSHDAGLHASLDSARENTTECNETGIVWGWNHLGDVKHERTVLVTVADADGCCIVEWALVESVYTVLLCHGWGRKVHDNHLKECVGGTEPLAHDSLHERLASQLLLVGGELHTNHDELEHAENWLEHELVETTVGALLLLLAPLSGLVVEEVVSPQLLDQLLWVSLELLSVKLGKVCESEAP